MRVSVSFLDIEMAGKSVSVRWTQSRLFNCFKV